MIYLLSYMKIWILSESQFGNGRKLADTLSKASSNNDVKVGDLKEVSPEKVANDKPDAIILGGAIRMFRGAPKSKKWIKKLDTSLRNINHEKDFFFVIRVPLT